MKINRFKLMNFVRYTKGDPKALTRHILKELLGEVKLANMTAKTIPENIFNAVESTLIKSFIIYGCFENEQVKSRSLMQSREKVGA